MKRVDLNYRIIIETERAGDNSIVYIAYCPTLGISDYGDSVEEARSNMHEAIQCHIEGLLKTGDSIPPADTDNYFVSTSRITVDHPVTFDYHHA